MGSSSRFAWRFEPTLRKNMSEEILHLRPRDRRGTVYAVVLSFGLLLTVIGLGAITAVRSYARAGDRVNDGADARNYALSATEIGRRLIAADPNWRTTYSNGTWLTNQVIGGGSFNLQVVNPNGALNNADNDPVALTGTGAKGSARQIMTVTLAANPTPLSSLAVGVDAGGAAGFNAATVRGNATISSGATLTLTNTSFNGNKLEGLLIVPLGCTGIGTQTSLAAARTLP